MQYLSNLWANLQNWLRNHDEALEIQGINSSHWSFFLSLYRSKLESASNRVPLVLVFSSHELAENCFEALKSTYPLGELLYFPAWETSPYLGIRASENYLYKRFYVLNHLANQRPTQIIVTTIDALISKLPPKKFFTDYRFTLKTSDIISPDQLAKKLVNLGYHYAPSIEEPGSFCKKGEIFDLYPITGDPVRLTYFDDMIEEIKVVDKETQKTIKDKVIEEVEVGPAPLILSQDKFSSSFKEKIPKPPTNFKDKNDYRRSIFQKLNDGLMFENYVHYLPLFFDDNLCLLDYLDGGYILNYFNQDECYRSITDNFELHTKEYNETQNDPDSTNLLPSHESLFETNLSRFFETTNKIVIEPLGININLNQSISNYLKLESKPILSYLAAKYHVNLQKISNKEFIHNFFDCLKKDLRDNRKALFTVNTKAARDEINYLLDLYEFAELKNKIDFLDYHLDEGFFSEVDGELFISDSDLFVTKKSKIKKSTKVDHDLFAEKMATLKKGDYVIHNTHGVGIYLGLEALNHSKNQSDFLVIQYANEDKVYVPIYKLNLIQKHADSTSQLSINNLRSNKFSLAKNKAKESAKKLAFNLLKLQAQRSTEKAFQFSPPDHEYKDFELLFPFDETDDQARAIDDVIDDMQKKKPMDRLVCGDVGFGKTEVAMRAAFKAVIDNKQVAVLVPTTILAMQHYHSFCDRFKKFPVRIEFLSRFKSPKESKQITEDLAEGKIDIVIGTHKLLSQKIKYHDLGIVIVDEEHRFGVAHKEKLKLLRASVDFLTLTATPIPRTLQLSYLGIRDLSLIKTAPPKRQSIKSYLVYKDDATIKQAIEKEVARGGQIFFLYNRVQDIELMAGYIRELLPKVKVCIGHGQLSEKDLEKRIQDFYQGKYDLLLSTTIIESGIDIPNANTMIIWDAQKFGLAQLHQLRGRIGRSDRKAYAYFVVPPNKKIGKEAEKRLEALQTYTEMGSGFSLATCDLEIRGAGDILGPEQSGHLQAIGLELYLELLNEAIAELKGEKTVINTNIEILVPNPAFIPNYYIEDAPTRLKYYKQLSNAIKFEKYEMIKNEIQDIYGPAPLELKNLFMILECRLYLQNLGLLSVKTSGQTIHMNFNKSLLETYPKLRDQLVDRFLSRPKVYNLSPDFSVIYTHKKPVTLDTLLEFSKDIAQQTDPC